MGRRNDHSREELRAMAIAAAGDIVAAEGLRGLTTRKVASLLGYSPGSLYVIFENLDDLVLHVNAATLTDLSARLAARAAAADDAAARIRALAHAYLDFAEAHSARWLSVFEHRLPEGALVPAWYEQAVAAVMALVREPVRDLRATATEDALDLETTALWGAVHGVCVLGVDRKLVAGGALQEPRAVLDTLLDSLIDGRR